MNRHRLLSRITGGLIIAFTVASCKTAAEVEDPEPIPDKPSAASIQATADPSEITSEPGLAKPRYRLRLGDDILNIPNDEELQSSTIRNRENRNTGVIVRPPSE